MSTHQVLSKNKLQEIFQKHNIDLPYYSSYKTSEDEWISKVSFVFPENTEKQFYEGYPSKRKRDSQSAAEIALNIITSIDKSKTNSEVKQKFTVDHIELSKKNIYVMVDYENINKINKLKKIQTYVFLLLQDIVMQKHLSPCLLLKVVLRTRLIIISHFILVNLFVNMSQSQMNLFQLLF